MDATPKLNEALVKAQKMFKPVPKDREGQLGNRKYKYSDLSSVMEMCKGPLSDNGLAVSQLPNNSPDGVNVVTTLRHVSGEVLSAPCWLPVVEKTPQGFGSAMTYARRYGVSAMLGIVTEEDDDGAAASRSNKPPPPEGMEALSKKLPPQTSGEMVAALQQSIEQQRAKSAAGPIFPAYGRSASQPIRGAARQDLEFYANGAKRTLADPAKARFHDKERQLLAAIEAEIARQYGRDDEPPPQTDADAPF